MHALNNLSLRHWLLTRHQASIGSSWSTQLASSTITWFSKLFYSNFMPMFRFTPIPPNGCRCACQWLTTLDPQSSLNLVIVQVIDCDSCDERRSCQRKRHADSCVAVLHVTILCSFNLPHTRDTFHVWTLRFKDLANTYYSIVVRRSFRRLISSCTYILTHSPQEALPSFDEVLSYSLDALGNVARHPLHKFYTVGMTLTTFIFINFKPTYQFFHIQLKFWN